MRDVKSDARNLKSDLKRGKRKSIEIVEAAADQEKGTKNLMTTFLGVKLFIGQI